MSKPKKSNGYKVKADEQHKKIRTKNRNQQPFDFWHSKSKETLRHCVLKGSVHLLIGRYLTYWIIGKEQKPIYQGDNKPTNGIRIGFTASSVNYSIFNNISSKSNFVVSMINSMKIRRRQTNKKILTHFEIPSVFLSKTDVYFSVIQSN